MARAGVLLILSLPAGVAGIERVGVRSIVNGNLSLSTDASAFIAGYLNNRAGYSAHNLDLHFVNSLAAARTKAVELGLQAVLEVDVRGFREEDAGTAMAEFRLVDSASGDPIKSWSAELKAPYFDPPLFRKSEPYGNLEQALSEMAPPPRVEPTREIRLLVVSDQRLRGSGGGATKEFLQSQLDIASGIFEREFGVRLSVVRMRRWAPPPDADIFTIAKAAATIRGRDKADLTLVCIGPPAPHYGQQRILGYARPLNNIVVNRVMNAHVFVHEIGHVLGAVHVDQTGCIMRPTLQQYALAGRLKVLPPIVFSGLNRSIIGMASKLSLGSDFTGNLEKLQGLLDGYESLRAERLTDVAPLYGDLLMTIGRHDEAIELFQESLRAEPNDESVRSMLLESLSKVGRFVEAQALAQQDFDVRQDQMKGVYQGRVALKKRAALRVSTSSIDFGVVQKDASSDPRSVVISNIGTGVLVVAALEMSGSEFSIKEITLPIELEAGESTRIEVVLSSTSTGTASGELTIETDGGDRKAVRISGKVQ